MATSDTGAMAPSRMGRLRLLLRLIGFTLAGAYVLIGTLVLLVLLIGGLWEGFGRQSYVLMFLGACLYVYGTAWVAFSFGRRPGRMRGLLLVLLVTPLVIHAARDAWHAVDLEEAAGVYARNGDPEAVATAREQLLAQGRRAGARDYVVVLHEALEAADNDHQRIRLVRLLGELSYQYEPLLESLRTLYRETGDDSGRSELHEATLEAIRDVNPYEPGLPERETDTPLPPSRTPGRLEVEAR